MGRDGEEETNVIVFRRRGEVKRSESMVIENGRDKLGHEGCVAFHTDTAEEG